MRFSDVPAGQWYSEAVRWAASEKLVGGYGDGRFGTNDPITQEHLDLIFQRHTDKPVTEGIPGFDGSSKPATRAQAAMAVMNCGQLSPETPSGGKTLVAYFSATGTTEPLAEYAADILGADLYEIVPEVPYTDADLAYYTDGRADREQNDSSARPAISGSVENMADYDVIFLGYPIWHGQAPRIISTFLENYDLTGKTIVPFCTSHSSGYSDSTIKPLAPGADWITGRRFPGGTSRDTVEGWIKELALPESVEKEVNKIYVKIGDTVWTAALEDNTSATALKGLLAKGPVTVEMHDYGNFEKVGSLGVSLPQSNAQITASPGDIILYQGNSVTIYYDESSWNFTRLGRLDGVSVEELRRVLKAGGGNVTVTFSLEEPKAAGVFDLESKTVRLNSGYTMPINGLGTYSLHGETCVNSVKSALSSGVRLIDTASAYGNEKEVGQAIREAIDEGIIRREDVFVITKIYPGSEMANPEQSIQACLDRLDTGYVDLMLLHHPDPNDVKAYKAMEQFVEAGKIRSIGLSNWYVKELEEFLPQAAITPALVQNEIHPYYQENDVIPFIQEKGIVVQGWYPLGGRGHTAELLGDSVISGIAKAHGVSSAQVILRWNLQKGVVVIPGSSNPDHIKENTELYHFELTEDEMAQINALDRNEKHDWY
jgi:diketogulonate reductase-like aldo/keto reductase/flavodoxin